MDLVSNKLSSGGEAYPGGSRAYPAPQEETEPYTEVGQTIIPVASLPNRIQMVPLHEQQSTVSQEWRDLVVRVRLHDKYYQQLRPLFTELFWIPRLGIKEGGGGGSF